MSEPTGADQVSGTSESGCSVIIMALNYYRCASRQERPDFVPHRIRIEQAVHGDFPCHRTVVHAGEHDCHCNQWGAVSVRASDGTMLGIKPKEFTPLSFRPNPEISRK